MPHIPGHTIPPPPGSKLEPNFLDALLPILGTALSVGGLFAREPGLVGLGRVATGFGEQRQTRRSENIFRQQQGLPQLRRGQVPDASRLALEARQALAQQKLAREQQQLNRFGQVATNLARTSTPPARLPDVTGFTSAQINTLQSLFKDVRERSGQRALANAIRLTAEPPTPPVSGRGGGVVEDPAGAFSVNPLQQAQLLESAAQAAEHGVSLDDLVRVTQMQRAPTPKEETESRRLSRLKTKTEIDGQLQQNAIKRWEFNLRKKGLYEPREVERLKGQANFVLNNPGAWNDLSQTEKSQLMPIMSQAGFGMRDLMSPKEIADNDRELIVAKKRLDATKRDIPFRTPEEQQQFVLSSRAQHAGLVERNRHNLIAVEVVNALQNVQAGYQQQSGRGDMAIVAGFAKILDPPSVVRPSEYQAVLQSLGVGERIAILPQFLQKGQRLPEHIRNEFMLLAEQIAAAKLVIANRSMMRIFKPMADDTGYPLGQIWEPYRLPRPGVVQVGGELVELPDDGILPDEVVDRMSDREAGRYERLLQNQDRVEALERQLGLLPPSPSP